jgi:hypothetical protein
MTPTSQNVARVSASFIRGAVKMLQSSTMPDPAAANASQERRNALDTLASVAQELDDYAMAFDQTTTAEATTEGSPTSV